MRLHCRRCSSLDFRLFRQFHSSFFLHDLFHLPPIISFLPFPKSTCSDFTAVCICMNQCDSPVLQMSPDGAATQLEGLSVSGKYKRT